MQLATRLELSGLCAIRSSEEAERKGKRAYISGSVLVVQRGSEQRDVVRLS
jgi:hypothetical protein